MGKNGFIFAKVSKEMLKRLREERWSGLFGRVVSAADIELFAESGERRFLSDSLVEKFRKELNFELNYSGILRGHLFCGKNGEGGSACSRESAVELAG
ncbi:hypothetical protein ETH_00017735, partial [Eimeria tenella]